MHLSPAGQEKPLSRPYARRLGSALLAALLLLSGTGIALAQTKSLKLYYLHTGEKAEIVFKRGNQYDQAGLKKINWFLRDWRRNEPTKIDPQLLDLVWEAYRQSGSKAHIHVISAYRAPASNDLLRSRGRGVAKNSQHTLGKAMDFFLPDVKLSKLREIGLKLGVGGVGYYPTSGSPFVHLDTGNVRHWPRMSRQELAQVFPDGKTMHVPTDGRPLARYEQAVAEYKQRKASGTLTASAASARPEQKELGLFQRLAQMTREDESDDAENNTAPAPRAVTTTAAGTPRPAEQTATAEVAPAEEEAPPAAPELPAPAFAELPRRVPVPELAPRRDNLDSGEAIAVASIVVEEPAPGEASTGNDADAAREEELQMASLVVPVPARRPEIPGREPAPVEAQGTQNITAFAPETAQSRDRADGTQIAALTADEIEDLRRQVIETISPQSGGADTSGAPVPSAAIPASSPAGTQQPDEAASQMQTAIAPEAEEATEAVTAGSQAPVVPAPVESPRASETIDVASLITPPAGESGASPVENPEAGEITLEEAVKETPAVALRIPVPERSPRASEALETVVASLEPEQPENAGATAAPATAASEVLPERTISLDSLSAPAANTTIIGQYALNTQLSIEDFANVQAPAYGRNMIRGLPEAVVVQGFDGPGLAPGPNGFRGRAVNAMRFARLLSR